MKKVLSILLATVMVFSLAACGGSSSTAPASEAAPAAEAQAEAAVSETAPAKDTEVVQSENAMDPSELTFGFIFLHDENSTYDRNFMDAAKKACENKGVNYLEKVGIPETNECYEAAADLVDRGANIIFADSFGHESFILQAAQEFPEVQFGHATGTMAHTEGLSNFHNAFADIYQGRYLAGVAAGMKLKQMMDEDSSVEPKVGYVGAFTYAEVISGYTSWFLGVRSIVPEVTMEVQFTGSWYDEALEKEAAQTLINDGCVLLSQHADSMGAPTACEEAGVPDVSYNGSTKDACPNTFIVSSRIDWTPYFEYMIDCVLNGQAIPADWCGSIETGSVVLTDINEAVAAPGTVEKVEEVKAGILDGSIKVFDSANITVEGKPLDSYMADVDTDPNYEKDTEAVSDGYFHESEYRSAPYFDVMIDGITTLNAMF
ncbi:MAG: BMP family ABC transporter substrate-binding protein [Lachnospiraceae bacterium]|nr:BMP family ABC transporter substrate-binding protein [Lachnospiraceae bacterium]